MNDTTTSTSCCGGAAPARERSAHETRDAIRSGYAEIARAGEWSGVVASGCCEPGSAPAAGGCCGGTPLSAEQVAVAVGYEATELASLPPGANMGLSCGNPTAIASLREGEVVLDLGSGGGFDCFVAGRRVGRTGRAIGVDMTPDMVSRARNGLGHYRSATGLDNVEFRLGEIEHLPVADASVDVVISNCVINLSTDKAATWREIARVLRPGGRVAISDLALHRPLPAEVKSDLEALVGCVAGAILVDETVALAKAAGLDRIEARAKDGYVSMFEASGDRLYERVRAALPEGMGPADYVTSLEVTARKPA